jgi:hypothetical protein
MKEDKNYQIFHNSHKEKPSGTFAQEMESEPIELKAIKSGKSQKVQLFYGESAIGWLGENSSGWCIVVGKEEEAVSITSYVYKGDLYYRKTDDNSKYLSVSNGWNYVGFYSWSGASSWKKEGDKLISKYTRYPLDYWSSDDNYVYANGGSDFSILTVKFT